MIPNPLDVHEIQFRDWDDSLMGVLAMPAIGMADWPEDDHITQEERDRKREEAKRRHPRQRVIPVERYYYEVENGALKRRHTLEYVPVEYIPHVMTGAAPFRPRKEG